MAVLAFLAGRPTGRLLSFTASQLILPSCPLMDSFLDAFDIPFPLQVVNKARVNEVADETALLAQCRREIAQLRAALLEGRGGMLITGDGDVVAAEVLLERLRTQHEERLRALEDALKS